MQEESKKIKLPLGDVSLKNELGVYYIDMRPAKIHYINNIYGGGSDSDGVPFTRRKGIKYYSAVNIAQFGFILHAEYLEGKQEASLIQLKSCIDKLVELATITENDCIWWHDYKEQKYNIQAPWASAMAQGEIISLFLRYYQITQDELYLKLSRKAFHFLKNDVSEKGVRRYDQNGDLWFEEYPSDPTSLVLNGYIYTLFGLYDLFRVTGDKEVKKDIDACIRTLKNNLHRFDAGYWSYYDLLKKELVRYYYQKNVHVPQLEVLFLLTQETIFLKYKNKWERTINPVNFAFVQMMYRILPRWRKKSLRLS
jgi:heparosan-N-sulfate-glucuronate 5-epimerase